MYRPIGITVTDDKVHVADQSNHRIVKFSI